MVKLGCKLFAVSLHRYPGEQTPFYSLLTNELHTIGVWSGCAVQGCVHVVNACARHIGFRSTVIFRGGIDRKRNQIVIMMTLTQ